MNHGTWRSGDTVLGELSFFDQGKIALTAKGHWHVEQGISAFQIALLPEGKNPHSKQKLVAKST